MDFDEFMAAPRTLEEYRRAVGIVPPDLNTLWQQPGEAFRPRSTTRNPDVRRVTRRELAALFPSLRGPVRSVAPWSWTAATLLEAIPFLRKHLVAVLRREG